MTIDHRARFRALHVSGCFVMPNPWDAGSALYLRHLGFKALASTSGGFAFSRGLPDSEAALPRDAVLGHLAELVACAGLPINADFQSGYGRTPVEVGESVRLCVATGVAGLSIEDATGVSERPLFEIPEALDRLRAARAAIDESGSGVLLTARAECYLTGHANPLRESIRRLQAYSEAGADVLYAPGPRDRADIEAIVAALAPKPVNVLMSVNTGLRVQDVAELGARRISVGSSLARAAWTGFMRAAEAIASEGSFSGFEALVPYPELNTLFDRGGL